MILNAGCPPATGATDGNGEVTITVTGMLIVSIFTIKANHPDYGSAKETYELKGDETNPIQITLILKKGFSKSYIRFNFVGEFLLLRRLLNFF